MSPIMMVRPCGAPFDDDDSRDVAAPAADADTVRVPAAGLGRGEGEGDGPSEEGKDSTGSFGIAYFRAAESGGALPLALLSRRDAAAQRNSARISVKRDTAKPHSQW